ncbi:esterase-like activity of phytase family protein [Sphingomonas oryzagri]|jgi:hypothetical protein|uniref:Esterase-like activity of phytase family protein n=1 Tax=Sphingomonas oryzagri TaxID=3042314 RepID=A0ABT6N7N7_9SPHN|nr:esterase-like activity of phytase family protein [Sphingomonas oryzagri]MDH7641100.1 esterase-like activity of phytase family protein [Sphingomonas oryzagri]
MHRLALLAALVAILPLPLAVRSAPQGVTATPVALDPADPGLRTVGALRYLGGWVLKGTDRRFGGISSMTIQDGHFVMLSDGGVVTRLRFSGAGAQADYAMSELPDGPGDGGKVDRDSESSTYDPATGHVWAGFETRNQIWRYTRGFAVADGHAAPKLMADWPNNEGAEAMVRLADGRFLVFAETKRCKDGSHFALLFSGDPVEHPDATSFCYKGPPGGFAPTDAAQLPDGRVLVLHRRFSPTAGFSAALTVIDPKAIVPGGAPVVGKLLAKIAPPLTVDNMEALAIEPTPAGPVVWIGSDDNYFFLERTLLMRFALPKDF